MMRADHQAEFEQLMACLDGELTAAEAASVRAHLATCAACQDVEAELRGVSTRLAAWTVGEPPASLKSPAVRSRMARVRGWIPVAAALVVAAGMGSIWLADQFSLRKAAGIRAVPSAEAIKQEAIAEESSAVSYARPLGDNVPPQDGATLSRRTATAALPETLSRDTPVQERVPLLARTARVTLMVTTLEPARAEVERITAAAGGYVGQIRISDDRAAGKRLSASLQVPEGSLDPVLQQLKRLGRTAAEGRDAEDVTRQSADLDARLNNARTSEKRLIAILANRAGSVEDVLNVEREIARVRGDIEQMEASRRSLDRRITYATIQLEMGEERKSELGLGDQSLSGKLRNAAVEGWNAAFESVLNVALFVAQVAPTMLLWGLALIVPYRLLRRRFAP